jgi:hypothetical protein
MSLLTPQEAYDVDCPLFRVCVNEDAVHHGADAIYVHEKCRGPGCKIGWRWASSLTVNNPNRVPGAGQSINKTQGYCGAFGRPE